MKATAVIMFLSSLIRDNGDFDVPPQLEMQCDLLADEHDCTEDALSGLLKGEELDEEQQTSEIIDTVPQENDLFYSQFKDKIGSITKIETRVLSGRIKEVVIVVYDSDLNPEEDIFLIEQLFWNHDLNRWEIEDEEEGC